MVVNKLVVKDLIITVNQHCCTRSLSFGNRSTDMGSNALSGWLIVDCLACLPKKSLEFLNHLDGRARTLLIRSSAFQCVRFHSILTAVLVRSQGYNCWISNVRPYLKQKCIISEFFCSFALKRTVRMGAIMQLPYLGREYIHVNVRMYAILNIIICEWIISIIDRWW